MKFDCELIQDLIPLYEEGLCSNATRQAVETHFQECEHCRRLSAPLPIETPEDPPAADRAVKKSMKKVRRRWLASLLAAVMVFPLFLLSFNQYRGSGLCFTNIDDVYTARQFLRALETKNWEKAARMHRFSFDYQSILEVLDQGPALWSSNCTPFELDGRSYTARGTHHDSLPETAADLYGYLYNLQGSAMIPTELWEELMTLDPAAFTLGSQMYWLNGECYVRITTPWGDYVANQGLSYATACDCCLHFDLVPTEIYREALPELDAEALRIYANTLADVGWVAELTEAEFTREMIRRYTADLAALEDTVTFDCTGYRSAGYNGDRSEGCWVIFDLTVTQGSKTMDTQIQINVTDGKIDTAGVSYEPGVQWLDVIDRALYPSAHAGY